MEITNFTPMTAVAGGVLIGAGASLLMWGLGRIAGISGIIRLGLARAQSDRAWRMVFLVGMLAAAAATFYFTDASFALREDFSRGLLALGGLLVGYGTALGSGCTSGHGVCGLARLSVRSLVATATFVSVGMLTVFILRHVMGAGS